MLVLRHPESANIGEWKGWEGSDNHSHVPHRIGTDVKIGFTVVKIGICNVLRNISTLEKDLPHDQILKGPTARP